MIQAEHLCKSFGKIRAIQDLSFAVGSGEILGLLGPNGAGKTTTMRILAGFFPPTSGRVSVNGADLFDFRRAVKRQIGYLPENVPLYQNLTAESFLGYVADVKGVPYRQKKKSIRHVIEQCNLGAVERRLIGGLSRGFRQRLGLAQALLGSPSVLILDEPTVGLDPKQITEIRSLIKTLAKERVVIISTHILPEASMLCSRVLIIHKGILVASGAPDELGYQLRRSGELMVHVRGSQELIEDSFREIEGIMAVRLENSEGLEHQYRLLYKKEKDIRGAIARHIVSSGFELLGIQESVMSLEDIFLKIVVREENVKSPS